MGNEALGVRASFLTDPSWPDSPGRPRTPASATVGASANSATAQCGDEITYTPSAAKRAFRLVVAGHCPVKFTVYCNGGQDPTPDTARPGASALVDCDPGKAVKTVTLVCQSNDNQDCAFSYEVTDIE
jgi:hypothetical protein